MSDPYLYPDRTEEITQKLYNSLLDLYAASDRMEGVSEIHYRNVLRKAREVLQEAEEFVEAPGDDYKEMN